MTRWGVVPPPAPVPPGIYNPDAAVESLGLPRPEMFDPLAGTPGHDSSVAMMEALATNLPVYLTPGTDYYVSTGERIVLQSGQGFWGPPRGKTSGATSSRWKITADHTMTGFIIDTPSGAITDAFVQGGIITTDMNPAVPTANALGGVRFQHSEFGCITDLTVFNTTDSAVSTAGVGNYHENLDVAWSPQGRVLTAPSGALVVYGTDAQLGSIEADGNTTVITYPGLYQNGVYLNCLTSTIFGISEGEFGEAGWYIDGPAGGHPGCGLVTFIGARATYNPGPGFYIASGASEICFVAPYGYNNSSSATAAYDHFYIANGAFQIQIVGGLRGASGPGFALPRSFYYDANALFSGENENTIDRIYGTTADVAVDTIIAAAFARSSQPAGRSNTSANRGPSRHNVGLPFYDTTLAEFVDAAAPAVGYPFWMDRSANPGLPVGNQLPPQYSENRQPTSPYPVAWTAGAGARSTVVAYTENATALLLGVPQVLKLIADATAVTDGFMFVSTQGLTTVLVDPTKQFSAMFDAILLTGGASNTGTLTMSIAWYNAGNTLISTTAGLGSTAVTTTAKSTSSVVVASASIPGTAVSAIFFPVISKTGMVAGVDTAYIGRSLTGKGSITSWVAN